MSLSLTRPALGMPFLVLLACGTTSGNGSPAPSLPLMVQELVIPLLPGCNATTPYPHDPAVDQRNGFVYYTDTNNSCLGRFDPATQSWKAWTTPTPGQKPSGLTVAPNGDVFYAGENADVIGRFDAALGKITDQYPVMTAVHTPVLATSTVWFSARADDQYGRLDTTTGDVTTWYVSTPFAQPYGIDVAPNGRIWIALWGTNALAEIDPQNPATPIEHVLPNAASRPRRLAVDKSGRVWFADYPRNQLGMFDPAANQYREWDTPRASGHPYGIVVGPDDRIWYNDDTSSVAVAFDPRTETSTVVIIPTLGSTARNMAVDVARRRVWLALSGTGRLGMIQLP